jgi:hypothetical protein
MFVDNDSNLVVINFECVNSSACDLFCYAIRNVLDIGTKILSIRFIELFIVIRILFYFMCFCGHCFIIIN